METYQKDNEIPGCVSKSKGNHKNHKRKGTARQNLDFEWHFLLEVSHICLSNNCKNFSLFADEFSLC